MQIIKYNVGNDKTKVIGISQNIANTTVENNSSGNPPSRGGGYDEDDGFDNIIYGDLYVKSETYTDDDDDDPNAQYFTEGGSITAEGDIKCSNLFVKVDGNETNIVSYVKHRDTSINNNTNKLTNHETRITALENRPVCDCSARIGAVEDDLAQLREDISTGVISDDLTTIQNEINKLKYGTYYDPVILLSGKISKYSYASATSSYHYTGAYKDKIQNISVTTDGGTMRVEVNCKEGSSIYIQSVHVTQEMSGETAKASTTGTLHSTNATINGRNDGAHWFEAYVDGYDICIREFHQKDGNNDSWGSDYWTGDGEGIRAINITAIGYMY